MHSDWLIPKWPAAPQVRALHTTRAGGRSGAPYDSMNLGDHVGDDTLDVGANRSLLHQAIEARPVFLAQVHGTGVLPISTHTPHGSTADACVSAETGAACCVLVADCLPVLITCDSGALVGAAHAGWRGLAGADGVGVLEAALDSFVALGHAVGAWVDDRRIADEILVWLGPCIGAQAFEVGAEVLQTFVRTDPAAGRWFAPHGAGKWLADLSGLARQRLLALGITRIYGNDGASGWCTASNPSRFFSHRRDQRRGSASGRMAACIWRV